MAAGAWQIYAAAKKKLGTGVMVLNGGVFKMSLFRNSASATITSLSSKSIWSQIAGQISLRGAYTTGGKTLASLVWSTGASAKQYKWSHASRVFSACASTMSNIRYALIHKSAGAVTSGHILCYCCLSTASFNITGPNTLTVNAHANGVFTLA